MAEKHINGDEMPDKEPEHGLGGNLSGNGRTEEITDPNELERLLNQEIKKHKKPSEPQIPEIISIESSDIVLESKDTFEHDEINTLDREFHSEKEDSSVIEITGDSPAAQMIDEIAGTKGKTKKDPLIGQKISVYKITGKLGEGGMGTVYEGRDVNTNRPVAIKTVPADASEEEMQRFRRETQAIKGLKHKNIVNIEQFGERDGKPLYIMESLPGNLPEKARNLGQAVDIIYGSACGLETAHNTRSFIYTDHDGRKKEIEIPGGIIHRDIKPDNIRLASNEEVKVTDWGLVELKGAEVTKLSQTGMIMGTPRYMSPEQITGEKLDAKTDVFSLGLVFYELLTGTLPWNMKKKNVKEIQLLHYKKLLKYDKEALEQARPSYVKQKGLDKIDIPETIDDLVYIMLQPDRAKRPSMTHVLDILELYKKHPAQRSIVLERRLAQAYEHIKALEKEKTKGKRWKRIAYGIGAAAGAVILSTILFLREPASEKTKREALAQYKPIAALYKDASEDADPESAIAKYTSFVEQANELRERHPDIEFESIEERLDKADQRITYLKTDIEKIRKEKEVQTKYDTLKKLVKTSPEQFVEQFGELRKQYPNITFEDADKLLEEAEETSRNNLVQRYDSQIRTIHDEFIIKSKNEEARISLEKLLSELDREPDQETLAKTREYLVSRLNEVRTRIRNAAEDKAFEPFRKKYSELNALEKEHKLIDAKALADELFAECQEKADEYGKIREMLSMMKGRADQLHKQILEYALEGDYENLNHSHKEIVEYTIASLKQTSGEDPRSLTPANKLSPQDLEERIKHHEVILKEMVRWKVIDIIRSTKRKNNAAFPAYATLGSSVMKLYDISENPNPAALVYLNLLNVAGQIEDNNEILMELKRRKDILKELFSKNKFNKEMALYYPTLFNPEVFDKSDEKIILKVFEEFKEFTKTGYYKILQPGKQPEEIISIHEEDINSLFSIFKLYGDKEALDIANKLLDTSYKRQYNRHDKKVYLSAKKTGPTTTTFYAIPQLNAISSYIKGYEEFKDKKFLNAAKNIADSYIEFVRSIDDFIPPDMMLQEDVKKGIKDTQNIMATRIFLNLAQSTGDQKYSNFAAQVMASVINKYLNITESPGILLKEFLEGEETGIQSTIGCLDFLKSLRELIKYEREQLQLKQKQEQKEEKGTMHESYFRRNQHVWQIPKTIKPSKTFDIPRRRYIFA